MSALSVDNATKRHARIGGSPIRASCRLEAAYHQIRWRLRVGPIQNEEPWQALRAGHSLFLRNTNVLRRVHAEALGGAARQIEPGAHTIRDAPGSFVVDPHGDRAAVVRVGHGQAGAERPGARCGCVAACVEGFAAGSAAPGGIRARENLLATRAIAASLDVLMNRRPARRLSRRDGQKTGKNSDAKIFHRLSPHVRSLW